MGHFGDKKFRTILTLYPSWGDVPIDEATVVVKEDFFEVDDALSLPAQGKPLDSDLDDMEKSSTIALEEMEKAAALVEDSYESEFEKPTDRPPNITNNNASAAADRTTKYNVRIRVSSVQGRDLQSILTSCSYTKRYLLDDYLDLPRDSTAILLSLDLPVTILHLLDPV